MRAVADDAPDVALAITYDYVLDFSGCLRASNQTLVVMPHSHTLPTLEEIHLARAAERERLAGPCECCRDSKAAVLVPVLREDDVVEIASCDPCADVILASYAAHDVEGN